MVGLHAVNVPVRDCLEQSFKWVTTVNSIVTYDFLLLV